MTIVYQDERIVVAVKPNGVLSTDEPGGMPSLLRQTLGTDCIRTVHRLDAQTGGLMVFARSRKAAALLSAQVRERQFSKGYLAVVHGVPQPPAGQLRDLLGRDSVRRVTFVADTPSAETREALLDYLSRHPDQPLTVREIAAGVEPDGVSLSAVYRILAELEAAGLIRRESRPGSREAVVQYVGAENCRGHLHLTCTRCGRTVHLSSAAASLLTGMAAGEGFSLDLTRTALYGLCPRCRQEVQP